MAKRRKSGTGGVSLRKDGRWEGRYVVGYDDKGLPKTKNVLAKTKAECQAKLKTLKAECAITKPDDISPDMRFGDWIDYWYQNYSKPKLGENTRQGYECCIYKHIIPELGAIPLNELTQNDLQQFYARLKEGGRLRFTEEHGKGLSDRMVRACHANCSMALNRAVADGLIRVNPASDCKLPPKKSKEMQVLTKEEMRRFLLQAKEEGYYELFLLELSTGLRRGELLALQWADLNFETGELRVDKQVYRANGKLTVSEPKTKASVRTVILPPSVLNMLMQYKQNTHSRWLFPSRIKDDAPLDPASCRKKLQVILERSGCKRVRFHDLRHTFCASCLEHGMDVKTLSSVIGHESVATTLDIYAHTTDAMRQDAADSIDRGIGTNDPNKNRSRKKAPENPAPFVPVKGARRRPGTGCVTQINENLWEGRYNPKWPDGKKHARNIYAHSLEECKEKLAEMILEVKAEIAAAKGHSTLSS